MKTFLMMTALLFSSVSFAGDRTTAYNVICKNLSFESERNKCVAQIRPFNFFNDQALALCATFAFDSKRLECLGYIADKDYEAYEMDTCINATFDSEKLECLKINGAPLKKSCLPRMDVLNQVNSALNELRARNYGTVEKRLMFLSAKFSENCQ